MNLQNPLKFLPLLCALSIMIGGLFGPQSAGAQQGLSSTAVIKGQTTCTDGGVLASVDVGNPLPGFTAYYDIELGDDFQTSDELATGQWYHFEFHLPHQEFAATMTDAIMTAYPENPDEPEDELAVQIDWPAVSCGPHPTIVTETVPTTAAVTQFVPELETTTTAAVQEEADVDIIDAATLDRSDSTTTSTSTTVYTTVDASEARDELAYTGPSRLNSVLALFGLGLGLIGISVFALRPRPLRK